MASNLWEHLLYIHCGLQTFLHQTFTFIILFYRHWVYMSTYRQLSYPLRSLIYEWTINAQPTNFYRTANQKCPKWKWYLPPSYGTLKILRDTFYFTPFLTNLLTLWGGIQIIRLPPYPLTDNLGFLTTLYYRAPFYPLKKNVCATNINYDGRNITII